MTVLPRSRRPGQACRSGGVLSRGCRPIVGSSSTYSIADEAACRSGWPAGCAAPRRRRGCRPAVEREVVEPDVEQEPEAGVDLLGHPLGDLRSRSVSSRCGEELGRLADRQVAHLRDVAVVDGDGEGLRLEAGAGGRPCTGPRACSARSCCAPQSLSARPRWRRLIRRDHAFRRRRVLPLAAVAVLVLDGDVALGALEDHPLLLAPSASPRRVHVDARRRPATESSMRREVLRWALRHGAMAPSSSDSSGSATTSSGSISNVVPRPSQRRHAP